MEFKVILYFIVFIIAIIYYNFKDSTTREGLTNADSIVLVGDSILNNTNYVSPGFTVYDLIKSKHENVKMYAADNSAIKDVIKQVENIPNNFNNKNTYIFVSAGGNDILNLSIHQDDESTKVLFDMYLLLIKVIKEKFPNANIVALNIYYPLNPYYKIFYKTVEMWNNLLKKNRTKGYYLIDINKMLTSEDDFTHDIEPSDVGGEKIANAIVDFKL
jgi:hypothetical protein